MKKIKKIILLLAVIFITGCDTTKENIEDATVKKVLDKYEYNIADETQSFGYAKKVFYASKDDVSITYVKGEKKYDIQGLFLDECENAYKKAESDYNHKASNGKNWASLTVWDSNSYYYVSWIGDSYITISASLDYKEEVKKIVNEIGY